MDSLPSRQLRKVTVGASEDPLLSKQPRGMTPQDLRAWQARMGFTYDTAAAALGVSRSTYAAWVAGEYRVDQRTALACAALAHGIPPWGKLPS